MLKFQFTKIFFLMLFCLAVPIRMSYALISPSSIHLVAAAIGPTAVYYFVVVIAFIIGLYLKIKNHVVKRFLLYLWLAIPSLIIIAIVLKYCVIKSTYSITNTCCQENRCDIPFCGELLQKQNATLSFSEFKKTHSINLNSVSKKDASLLQWVGIDNYLHIRVKADTRPLVEKSLMNYPLMRKFLKNFDKNQKIVFYFVCNDYADLLAYSAYNLGYDAYFTGLSSMENTALSSPFSPKKVSDFLAGFKNPHK